MYKIYVLMPGIKEINTNTHKRSATSNNKLLNFCQNYKPF